MSKTGKGKGGELPVTCWKNNILLLKMRPFLQNQEKNPDWTITNSLLRECSGDLQSSVACPPLAIFTNKDGENRALL